MTNDIKNTKQNLFQLVEKWNNKDKNEVLISKDEEKIAE